MRRRPGESGAEDLRRITAAQVVMNLALRGNGRVRVAPIDLYGLGSRELAQSAVDQGVAGEVHAAAGLLGLRELEHALAPVVRATTMANMRCQAVALGLVRSLDEAGVDCLVFKGLPTAALTRTHPLTRPSSDIDILVRPAQVVLAARVLIDLGAEPGPRTPSLRDGWLFRGFLRYNQEVPLSWLGVHVDLHWQLGFSRALLPDAGRALSRAVRPAELGIPTLSPVDAMPHASLHWRYNEFRRLKYALDLLGMVDAAPQTSGPGAGHWAVRSAIALAVATGSGETWEYGRPPTEVRSADWSRFLTSVVRPRRLDGGSLRGRLVALAIQARTTPTWRDRRQIPLRASMGPLTRFSDRVAGRSSIDLPLRTR